MSTNPPLAARTSKPWVDRLIEEAALVSAALDDLNAAAGAEFSLPGYQDSMAEKRTKLLIAVNGLVGWYHGADGILIEVPA